MSRMRLQNLSLSRPPNQVVHVNRVVDVVDSQLAVPHVVHGEGLMVDVVVDLEVCVLVVDVVVVTVYANQHMHERSGPMLD